MVCNTMYGRKNNRFAAMPQGICDGIEVFPHWSMYMYIHLAVTPVVIKISVKVKGTNMAENRAEQFLILLVKNTLFSGDRQTIL